MVCNELTQLKSSIFCNLSLCCCVF